MKRTVIKERVLPLSFILLTLFSRFGVADEELIAAGEQQALVCKACHQFEPNGVTLVGPPLWGIAERDIASFTGFNYSEGLKQHQGKWDADKLDAFLSSPNDFAPGTNMVFPGVKTRAPAPLSSHGLRLRTRLPLIGSPIPQVWKLNHLAREY